MQFYVKAGEARAHLAPTDASPEMSAIGVSLQRDAILCLLRAVGHSLHGDASPASGGDPLAILDEVGLLPPSDARSAAVRTALAADDVVTFDRMSPADLDGLKRSFEALRAQLRARIDLRTDAYFRGLGIARVAVASVVLVYGLVTLAGHLLGSTNVARGRPVTMSSRHPGTPDPSGLVDGDVDGSYGACTEVGSPLPPWIVVDLQQQRHIRRIVVYNRGDVNLDDGLPYSVSVSADGRTYLPIATRADHFGSGGFLSPPWAISCDVRARYVRIQARGYIALRELEVFEKT
jgi:hypothetical protein